MRRNQSLAQIAATGGVLLLAAVTPAAAGEPFELSIMTFNVNDLPSPLRRKASEAMKLIGRELARRRDEGTAPDLVFLQEAFTKRSRKLIREAGYPHVVKGPGVRAVDPASRTIEFQSPRDPEPGGPRRSYNRFVNSGLYILSRYPLVGVEKRVYGNDCSGSDCFANKGILYARVQVPGAGDPIDVATTHMDSNTRDAAQTDRFRAHWAQTGTLLNFLEEQRQGRALILAGDLNIRDGKRYAHFTSQVPALNAGDVCLANRNTCMVSAGTKPDKITSDTNDFHFIYQGTGYRIEPIAMARTYGEKMNGVRLSDHAAFEATYRLIPE